MIAVLTVTFFWKFTESYIRWNQEAIGTVLTYEETPERIMPSFTVYRSFANLSLLNLEEETLENIIPRAGVASRWKTG